MFSKSNIYAKDWLDTVFANRNKEYGGYQLRQMSGKATNYVLGIVFVPVLGISGLVYANQSTNVMVEIPMDNKVTVVELMDDLVIDAEPLEMKKSEVIATDLHQDVPAQYVLKFTEINTTNASKVSEDLVSAEDALDKKTILGNITMSDVKGGELV